MDDNAIVELYLSRDERAIAATQAKYGARLKAIAAKVCGERTAEECENDVYLAAWNSIPPNEPRSYLFAYLARITRGLAVNRLRSELAQKRSADLVELTSEMETCIPSGLEPDKVLEGEELSRAVSAFLLEQPELKRIIFMRRYWFMDSSPEIAKRLGISTGKVRTTLFRLRGKLREYLESEGNLK